MIRFVKSAMVMGVVAAGVVLSGCGGSGARIAHSFTENSGAGAGMSRSVKPRHLAQANELADGLATQRTTATLNALGQTVYLDYNDYAADNKAIVWKGENGAVAYKSRNQCAPFVTQLLMHAYGLTKSYFTTNFNSDSPNPPQYLAKIKTGTIFTQVTDVTQLQPGDFLCSEYDKSFSINQNAATGHIMIVDSVGTATDASATDDPTDTLNFYDVTVVDCSSSRHGAGDTRTLGAGEVDQDGTNDGIDSGVGRGVVRLYVQKSDGQLAGWRWSVNDSKYWTQFAPEINRTSLELTTTVARPMVIGRFTAQTF